MVEAPGEPIRDWLRAQVDAGVFPGATWWTGDAGGARSRGAVGSAAIRPRVEPASEDTPYDLASLTKPLCTALLAVLLEQDGQIDLDGPAGERLVELTGSSYAATPLVELGSHGSGLPAWKPLYLEASSLPGYLWRIAEEPVESPPGTTLYSDLGYILLGAALERAAGTGLDVLFETRVAAPLGLRATGFPSRVPCEAAAATEEGNRYEQSMAGGAGQDFPWRDDVVRGAVHDVNAHALGGVAGHAGLFGTAAEVASVAREMISPALLKLDDRARLRLLRPSREGGDRTFGFELARASAAARGVLSDGAPGHVGFTGTSVWLEPAHGDVHVLLTNRVHPSVRDVDFQAVRHRFHRLATALAGPERAPATGGG